MAETKNLPLAVLLSVAPQQKKMFTKSFGEIKQFLAWMTGQSCHTHDASRLANACSPFLIQQHPFLANIDVSDVSSDNVYEKLADFEQLYGSSLSVTQMPSDSVFKMSPQESLSFAGVDPEKTKVVEIM